MISWPIVSAATLLEHNFVFPEIYVEKYEFDNGFQDVYEELSQGNQVEELDYHVYNNFLYHLGKLFIPQGGESECHNGSTHFSYCWKF